MATHESFLDVLAAGGCSAEIPASDDVYGWLIGSWELELCYHRDSGETQECTGEAHFSWILEGRAIQDVWIGPRRALRGGISPQQINLYGTTLRMYDRALQAWRVTWFNPVSGAYDQLIGRWNGADILQEGKNAAGATIRWCFTQITPHSFRWTGERLEADGETWKLQAEFQARRMT